MSTSTAATTGGGGGGVGGALSLMGCVREASPPPQNHHHHHHHRTLGLGEFSAQASVDPLPKEPKKRRFHPLRGLRKIFRRKSRGAADVRLTSGPSDRDAELARMPREDVTMRHPAGRPEEARSRSASELLTDSCDRESSSSRSIRSAKRRRVATPVKSRRSFKHVFLRRSGMEDSFTKLRGGAGKLSVSHDSVFPGEVPSTRPLSSLDSLATLERRQGRKSNEIEHKEYNQHVAQRHRISLRVLEQIKTVIENRNQLASATSTDSSGTTAHSAAGERYQQETAENRFGNFEKHERNAEESGQAKITRPAKDSADRIVPVPKEDLPQFESASLNHTAALHRISVRPKNRRPPRRSTSQTNTSTTSASTITTIAEDVLDSLEPEQQPQHKDNGNINNINLNNINNNLNNNNTTTIITNNNNNNNNSNSINNYINNANNNNNNNANNNNNSPNSSNASSPTEPKSISVTRKSSSRLSRTSDIFEELESRFPRKPSSVVSLSPDSLDAANAPSRTSVETSEDQPEVRSVTRKPSNRISKGSDVFEELESKLPRRRSSSNRLSKSPDSLEVASCWFSKSTEGFELLENEESKPVAARRQLSQISKSTDRVSKSSDSLEAIEALASDDSIERRRCSFEFRARRSSKVMSKSSESFEVLELHAQNVVETMPDLQKRSSVSEINLARGARRLSKSTSKSSESFEKIERMEISESKDEIDEDDQSARSCRRSSKRMSSESSDNLELDDRLENRRVRRTPKRIPSTSVVDIMPADDHEEERRPTPTRKPSRLQKSSESSELGSTDTLDSERRNKSSESTETLDSLEKDLEQDRKEEEIMDSVVDRREKNDSWSNRTVPDTEQMPMADGVEDSKPLISPDKFYWRQTSDTKENIDIHQLLAITIVTRMADNGNNQRNSVIYPKKKQQMTASPPTSPVANKQQEDNKTIFDNLLASKNDEDLQNMLNGNISEVSTDTKSFKEKLIMFEKLGK